MKPEEVLVWIFVFAVGLMAGVGVLAFARWVL